MESQPLADATKKWQRNHRRQQNLQPPWQLSQPFQQHHVPLPMFPRKAASQQQAGQEVQLLQHLARHGHHRVIHDHHPCPDPDLALVAHRLHQMQQRQVVSPIPANQFPVGQPLELVAHHQRRWSLLAQVPRDQRIRLQRKAPRRLLEAGALALMLSRSWSRRAAALLLQRVLLLLLLLALLEKLPYPPLCFQPLLEVAVFADFLHDPEFEHESLLPQLHDFLAGQRNSLPRQRRGQISR
mmetsp:Transcript_74358/g.155028  ORF Transcript_74358/g.155028 Transcript_74358/m.155028 type:complete len:240 (-) Transcript_74358:1520-2239(-)